MHEGSAIEPILVGAVLVGGVLVLLLRALLARRFGEAAFFTVALAVSAAFAYFMVVVWAQHVATSHLVIAAVAVCVAVLAALLFGRPDRR